MVQWLGIRVFTAEGPGSIPGQGTKIPKAVQHSQGKKEEREVRAQGFLWPHCHQSNLSKILVRKGYCYQILKLESYQNRVRYCIYIHTNKYKYL